MPGVKLTQLLTIRGITRIGGGPKLKAMRGGCGLGRSLRLNGLAPTNKGLDQRIGARSKPEYSIVKPTFFAKPRHGKGSPLVRCRDIAHHDKPCPGGQALGHGAQMRFFVQDGTVWPQSKAQCGVLALKVALNRRGHLGVLNRV